MSSERKGWVYILSNPSIQGRVKIGFTDKAVEMRMEDLFDTGLPTPFVKEYEALVVGAQKLERQVHKALSLYRVNDRREFFECPVELAVNAIISKANELNIEILHQESYYTPQEHNSLRMPTPVPEPVPELVPEPDQVTLLQSWNSGQEPDQGTPCNLFLWISGIVSLSIIGITLLFADLNFSQQIVIVGLLGGPGLICLVNGRKRGKYKIGYIFNDFLIIVGIVGFFYIIYLVDKIFDWVGENILFL
ncbi:GIY-YIG nuclease family protein [Verrucomicrobia bacterium]|nr:GIY-YIG nuclease family protein [Verrucomicrobiota bacterium]